MGLADQGPSLTRAPVRRDRQGVGSIAPLIPRGCRLYTRSLSNRTPVLSRYSSVWVNEFGRAPRSFGTIESQSSRRHPVFSAPSRARAHRLSTAQTSKPRVGGSNPSGRASGFNYLLGF